MIVFADASAIVAVLTRETDEDEYVDRLGAADRLLWSPITRWEVTAAVARQPGLDRMRARVRTIAFGEEWDFTLVPIGEREEDIAFDAYRRYGKGSGHVARLNMGDCFAYACARANDARLLYKGDDFAATDLAS